MRASAKLISLVAAAAFAAAPPAFAAAGATTTTTAKPSAQVGATGKNCWSDLIKDWYDGRIDKVYPVHCYKDALRHLPSDVKTYSDAYDVISRALADATRGKKTADPNALVQPPSDGTSSSGGSTTTTTAAATGGGKGGGGTGAGGGTTGGGSPANGNPTAGGGPIGGVLNTGDKGASGVPIPLLVLGAFALLLVAAGGAGVLARRVQARRGGGPTLL